MNDACNLIRTATENNDVQINFGVVFDEKMGNTVKITVIATGFQRDSLPEIERRNPHFPFSAATIPDPAEQHQLEAEAEPAIVVQNGHPEPALEEMPPVDDYDTPAILRKQRRSVQ